MKLEGIECICGSLDIEFTEKWFRCNSCKKMYFKHKGEWFIDDAEVLADELIKIKKFMGKRDFLKMWINIRKEGVSLDG